MTAPPPPKSVFGYDVIDRLGSGAGSALYVVSQPKTGQLYALKHVLPVTDKDQRYVEQLRNELEVSKNFRHPALRKSVDMQTRKRLFGRVIEAALVMELIDGVTLDRDRPDDVAVIVDCFTQTALALAAMHNLLLVHCDLKPGNIMRQPDGKVKVIDFGQTCRIGTVKKRVQGTPDFIAPEQAKLKAVGIFTDVYNLGATLYWTLTDQKVPTLLTVKKSERDVVREQKFPRPADLNPAVPAPLSDLVMDCLRTNPTLARKPCPSSCNAWSRSGRRPRDRRRGEHLPGGGESYSAARGRPRAAEARPDIPEPGRGVARRPVRRRRRLHPTTKLARITPPRPGDGWRQIDG